MTNKINKLEFYDNYESNTSAISNYFQNLKLSNSVGLLSLNLTHWVRDWNKKQFRLDIGGIRCEESEYGENLIVTLGAKDGRRIPPVELQVVDLPLKLQAIIAQYVSIIELSRTLKGFERALVLQSAMDFIEQINPK